MDKNIQSVYRTPNGYWQKFCSTKERHVLEKEEFQFLEKKLVSTHDEALQPKKLKPLFKWSGANLEIPKFANYFPKSFDRFVEPFVGGASSFFIFKIKKMQFRILTTKSFAFILL